MHTLLTYRKILIFLFPLLILWNCSYLSDAAGSGPVFSLDAKKIPLGEVLKRISSFSGCEIAVDNSWLDVPVTVHLENVTLERALERVLSSLGNPNHIVVTKGSKVELLLCASPSERTRARNGSPLSDLDISTSEESRVRLLESFLDEDPPTGDELSLSSGKGPIDPLDVEVIPPEKPGGKGITERELIAMRERQKQIIDPLDLEVIPPERPGEKGITERQLMAMIARQKRIDPLDLEVIPPD